MLKETLEKDLAIALKNHQEVKVSTLRFLLAAIRNREIELRGSRTLTGDDVLAVIRQQVKTHKESVESFEKGRRPELAEKERNELEILRTYLPAILTEAEVRSIVSETLKINPAANFGVAMKTVLSRLQGQADGALVARLVKEYFESRPQD